MEVTSFRVGEPAAKAGQVDVDLIEIVGFLFRGHEPGGREVERLHHRHELELVWQWLYNAVIRLPKILVSITKDRDSEMQLAIPTQLLGRLVIAKLLACLVQPKALQLVLLD